ncbi:extracellular solute-binding protein [Paenibacillus eucommiae]|uniref:ABC-type glycerol-3-phosphate transport system substrate-binding protein n=1 Tax=Paenibacillus eucommiae TaxID=1355755 RepID=A0ABS4J7C4_9BACL|nr:extracellular solute-binding protein [Paenibacillus eucommiae]MBP1995738.1 ABC-type glycerol-3-phosphate transport system substrate-binding protein [Paenibacillus eucommiae]
MKHATSRKTLTLLLAFVLVLGLLAACGKKEANKGSTQEGQEGKTEQTGEGQKESPVDISVMRVQWSDEKLFSPDNAMVKEINKAANVNLKYEVVDSAEYENKLNLTMAGGELPDIMYVSDLSKFAEYAQQGAFLAIDEYLDKYPKVRGAFADDVWEEVRNASTDGNIYFLPLYTGSAPFVNIYRQDWLEKLGLPEPKTVEEFENMLIQFRDKDLDGNSKKDTIPLAMSATSVLFQARDLAPMFGIPWLDGWMPNPEKSDEIMLSGMNPKMKDFLKFMHNLRQEGLLDSEFIVGKKSGRDKFVSGNVGALVAHVNETPVVMEGLAKTDPNAKINITGALIGADGQKGGMSLSGRTVGGFVINAKSKDKIDKIFQYLEWQASTGKDMIDWGIEGKTYIVEDGVKKILPTEQIPNEYQGLIVLKLVFNQEYSDAHHNWLRNFSTKEEFDAFMVKVNDVVDNGLWDEASKYRLTTEDSKKYSASLGPMVEEFATKAIIEQNFDIDKEWDKLKDKWYNSGGKAVTDSFNALWQNKKQK